MRRGNLNYESFLKWDCRVALLLAMTHPVAGEPDSQNPQLPTNDLASLSFAKNAPLALMWITPLDEKRGKNTPKMGGGRRFQGSILT